MPEGAGEVFAPFVRDQLGEERDRKSSLEQRGLAVITSSGAFVTLVLAVAALVTGAKDFELSDGARHWLLGALIAFVAAAVLGVLCNAPLEYNEPGSTMESWLEKHWEGTAGAALKATALADLQTLRVARNKNGGKARLLTWAIASEVAGLLFVAIAAGLALLSDG